MKPARLATILLLSTVLLISCSGPRGEYKIQPVPFTHVSLNDAFWSPRMETNRDVTIPYAYEQCQETGRLQNFAAAGGIEAGHHVGYRFNDSDVYKIIEGAAYALQLYPDEALEARTDQIIDWIAAAQEDDGYLFTAKTAFDPENPSVLSTTRWENIESDHELYCVGHLYEAAVAYAQATGKEKLLNVALKNAALIDSVFGPHGNGHPPGHEEIEIGLVRLYRHTGEKRWLDLAKHFLDVRGDSTTHDLYGQYAQDHLPVTEQTHAVGHAVRAAYLYTGMADVAALTGQKDYINAIETIWKDVQNTKLYLTGGIGASGSNEGFEGEYHLPNASAYCETCASIANAMWNHRMFLMTGDSRYMDVVERVVYNSFLSGVGMEGNRFFYPNHLQSFAGTERQPWFKCACCPSNVVRFLPSLPGYAFASNGQDIYINLYLSGEVNVPLAGESFRLRVASRYPWDGHVRIEMLAPAAGRKSLKLRIPGWNQGWPVPGSLYHYLDGVPASAVVKLNGETIPAKVKAGYVTLSRTWQKADVVELSLSMPIRFVAAHDSVAADAGRMAVERGPLVFAAEGMDNASGMVRHLLISEAASWKPEFREDLLGGILTLNTVGVGYETAADKKALPLAMIPYYAWAHRGRTEMSVWLAREEGAVMPLNRETLSARSRVSVSSGKNEEALNDQLEAQSSMDDHIPRFHWWPEKGSVQWVQYDFPRASDVAQVKVYWFDDTGRGSCRVPKSWKVLYLDKGAWKPVWSEQAPEIRKNAYSVHNFEPVHTKAMRLEIQSQEGLAGGIYEWMLQ